MSRRSAFIVRLCVVAVLVAQAFRPAFAQPALPELTQPVNDFAHVIDGATASEITRIARALDSASSDALVVATVPNLEGFGSIDEYAVKLFENHGRGIGRKGKDNGVLILVAPNDRKVRIEVGYDLEQFITDGYAGETIRDFMAPAFRRGDYSAGILAAATRIAGRIAQARGVSIDGVRPLEGTRQTAPSIPLWLIILIFVLFVVLSRGGGGPGRGSRYWGGGSGWSGWSSGVGPFGGGWSGGGGGFGGGFGGFGGGRSGGGGASGSW